MAALISRFLKGLRNRTLVFTATFVASILLTGLLPSVREQINWYAQHELCRAAATGSTRKMKMLLFVGAKADGSDATYRPLLFAARNGQAEAAELLLSEGADINGRGATEQTPLMEAVWGKQTGTVRFLLRRGAKVYVDARGSALWQATASDQAEIVALLMRHGAADSPDAESALSLAVENAQSKVVKELLAGGVDPEGVTATAQVLPLRQVAAMNGDKETLRLLRNIRGKQQTQN